MFNNLRELIATMPDENTCRQYLAKQRWNGKTVCPYCKHDKCYTIEGGRRYKCASKVCFKRFTVTVGTIFEASNVPLNKWFPAIYLATAHKKGISSYQLSRDIGVTQKTAWFMLHRIREVIRVKKPIVIGKDNPVEADETFVGGSISNKHNKIRAEFATNPHLFNKTVVLGMIERGGQLITKVIPYGRPYEIVSTVAGSLSKGASLMTDTTNLYARLGNQYTHQSVNHSKSEYVRGTAHTNTIEGAFSHFKRMIYGIYHQISPKHTQRYCDEFSHRFNTRGIKDADRFNMSFTAINCRLKYKTLIAVTEPEAPATWKPYVNNGKGVIQMKDGEIIAHYSSYYKASKLTGVHKSNIVKVCQGKKLTAGGFQWCFA